MGGVGYADAVRLQRCSACGGGAGQVWVGTEHHNLVHEKIKIQRFSVDDSCGGRPSQLNLAASLGQPRPGASTSRPAACR